MSKSVGWILSLSDGVSSLYYTGAAPRPGNAGDHWLSPPHFGNAWTWDRSLAYPFETCQEAEKVMYVADLHLLHNKGGFCPLQPYPEGSSIFMIVGEDFPFRPQYQLQIMCVHLTGGKPSKF